MNGEPAGIPRDILDLRPNLAWVITDKEINPAQLGAELGTNEVWVDGKRILAAVGQATLEAAIAAHVYDLYFGEPDEDRQLGALRAKAQAVLAGTDTFTAAQIQRVVAGLVLRATRRQRRPG